MTSAVASIIIGRTASRRISSETSKPTLFSTSNAIASAAATVRFGSMPITIEAAPRDDIRLMPLQALRTSMVASATPDRTRVRRGSTGATGVWVVVR